jgi:hypothetical protein
MSTLFFSYSHKDEDLRNELEDHLAMLKNDGTITTWHDRRITAGADLDQEILSNLESADVILLLVSAAFLASNYCFHEEMRRALAKNKEGSAIVIPVILHPCDWLSSILKGLRATPTDGKPVSMFGNQHEAFAIITKDIRNAIAARNQSHSPIESPVAAMTQTAVSSVAAHSLPRSSNLRLKKKFDDHERDQFLEDSYEYIARHFEGSLQELEARNPRIKTRFKRKDASSFSASIYENGTMKATCSIWYGGNNGFSSNSISYSNSTDSFRNSMNESLTVEEDGYALHLKPMGLFHVAARNKDGALSPQGAAEFYWSMLIRPLQ